MDIKKIEKWESIGLLNQCSNLNEKYELVEILETVAEKMKKSSDERFNGVILPIVVHVFHRNVKFEYDLMKKTYDDLKYRFKEEEDIPHYYSIDAEATVIREITDEYIKRKTGEI